MRAAPASLLLAAAAVSADAGFFGTMAQHPVPHDPDASHPHISMESEQVVVMVGDSMEARIVADFLFEHSGAAAADTVVMYYPWAVRLPVHSVLWSLDLVTDPMDVSVRVDGEPVETWPMLACRWSADRGLSWSDVLEGAEPLRQDEPADGEVFHVRLAPGAWEQIDMDGTPDAEGAYRTAEQLAYSAHACLCCWAVPFEPGSTRLVEVSMDYVLTTGYGERDAYVTYPLYTGASWSGAIGRGRLMVVPGEGVSPKQLEEAASVSMPEPRRMEGEGEELSVLPEIEGHPAFRSTELSALRGTDVSGGWLWEFEGLEPVVPETSWQYFYVDPITGHDMNGLYYPEAHGSERPWASAIVARVRYGGVKW